VADIFPFHTQRTKCMSLYATLYRAITMTESYKLIFSTKTPTDVHSYSSRSAACTQRQLFHQICRRHVSDRAGSKQRI